MDGDGAIVITGITGKAQGEKAGRPHGRPAAWCGARTGAETIFL
jgi:hypothetical protein